MAWRVVRGAVGGFGWLCQNSVGGVADFFYLCGMKPLIHNEGQSRRITTLFTHLLFVVIIFILPEMLMGYAVSGKPSGAHTPWGIYIKSGLMVLVFYVNYYVIINRTLTRRNRWWHFILWNLVLIAAVTLVMYAFNHGHVGGGGPRRFRSLPETHVMAASLSIMLRDVIMLVLTVALAVALRLSSRWIELERRRSKLAADHRENELNSLRSQLNPHFLFNTLNTIYSLIEISPAEAQRAVHDLSALLRYVVYENPERVAIEREVEFIDNYVELMRLRLGERPIRVSVDIDSKAGLTVPPLLFVTLIENAFKHGNTTNTDDPIEIRLKADARRIVCSTVNHVDADARRDKSHSGVGLANLRRRLELIYGQQASLDIKQAGNLFTATVTIDRPCQSSDV